MVMHTQIEECILAIMDSTVNETARIIDNRLLEVDKNGYTPESNEYNPSLGPSCITIVADNSLKVHITTDHKLGICTL